jgi:membrane protein YqaA with SNARE-associated domain
MQILLTALATVLGGALTLALGQIILRGLIEPALELKRQAKIKRVPVSTLIRWAIDQYLKNK